MIDTKSYLQRIEYFATRNKVAIRTEHSEMSYQVLAQDITKTMRYLIQQGISSNSVVGITLSNELDHLILSLALLGLGVNQITLASHDTISVKQELAKRVGVTHVISKNVDDLINAKSILYSRNDLPDDLQSKVKKFGEGILYLQSSGTSGIAKIVPLLETHLIWQASRGSDVYANQSFLRLASIEHGSGKRHRLYCVWNGGINVFRPNDNYDITDYIKHKEVTSVGLSRMQISSILKQAELRNISSIELHIGGSAVPYKLRAAVENSITKKFYVRYGTSEFGFVCTAKLGEHDVDECSGKLAEGVELEIVDNKDNPLPKGSRGLIRIRAKGMCSTYHDNIEQSINSFKNGWFYPGDLGYYRDDDRLVVLGRADDMIIMDTINIFPSEIIKVLEAHSNVKTAIALPIESAIYGQIPVAAVELNTNHSIESRDLLKYCREKLGIRSPKRIIISPNLPRSSNGKVNNALIRKMFAINNYV